MPVSLSVKEVPDQVAERLRTRALSNHRSLQGELMAILEAAANAAAPVRGAASASVSTPPLRGTQTIEEALVDLKRIFPKPVPDPLGAARIVRGMRDSRYGASTVRGQPSAHRISEGSAATRKPK